MPNPDGMMRLFGMWTGTGSHAAGWRMPDAARGTAYDFRHTIRIAQLAEQAKMDALFFADSNILTTVELIERGDRAAERSNRPVRLDAVTTITGLSTVTERIGLVATATTTYNEPFNVARRFATLEQISNGRAGWNVVTSQHENEAPNYGFEQHMEHDERYRRAEEFFDVCAGLWDCWDEGAIVEDKERARYSVLEKFRILNHSGKYFKVKGPLNIPRSPQGRPIIAQAGSSVPGRNFASRVADVIYLSTTQMEEAIAFRADVRSRAASHGRNPDHIKMLPALMPIVGQTEAEAEEHYLELQSLITDEQAIIAISFLAGGLDLMKFPIDGPLPELPPSNGSQTKQQQMIEMAKTENLSIRQIGCRFAESIGHKLVYGTPKQIADVMEEWYTKEACDGFCVVFPYYPRGVEDAVKHVVPELQRRGLFRTEYEGRTLRENLGVPQPQSHFD